MTTKIPFRKTIPGRILCILLVMILAAGAAVGALFALDPNDCRIFDGVTVGGVDLGGMTRREARDALSAALEESLYSQPLTVQLPEEVLSIAPGVSGVTVDVAEAVRAAYAYGRKDEATESQLPLLPWMQWKEDSIRTLLTAYADRWNTELQQPSWRLEGDQPSLSTETCTQDAPTQTLVLTRGVPALHLDVDGIYAMIESAYDQAVFLCAGDAFTVVPEVIPEALPEELDLAAIAGEVSIASVDDSLDMQTYGFVHGSYGYGFDPDAAAALLAETGYGESVLLSMSVSAPEILGEGVYFRDVLGHCETKHTDDENRNTNLRLLCEALDGVILQPGEEFSYNGTVGERTEEKGYKPATAYSGKTMIKDIGGGVCQGSTTLYNCALLADLEITERVCHGAKVGYVQLGLDAAVNWATKTDLKFKNNFNFPMMIKAEVSDGYVKMQILGTDEKDYYIEMRCGNSQEGDILYAVSYKVKYDKETGEQISKEREAFSTYYPLG